MGSLATAMANLVQHIQGASEQRHASLGQMHHQTQRFLGDCRAADRTRAGELRQQLDGAEKARLEAAQKLMRSSREAIRNIGVRVSELRSDTHNLVQRFTLEHRDMGQALRGRLASEKNARVGATRQTRRALRAKLRADARNLHTSLRTADNARKQATQQMMAPVAADIRQASRNWREGLKKKEAPSIAGVITQAAEAIREVAGASVVVEEPTPVVPAEEPRGEVAVEEEQAARAAARAERVLSVIQAHPDGIRLVEIGNEMGVDWRGLIAVVRSLMDEGKVEKIDDVYYPAQR